MRKAQKQEILELLNSLGQAHEEIIEVLRGADRRLTQNIQKIQGMLGDCQEVAISLGEAIEELEGKDHETVQSISEYCETVYEIYKEIGETDGGVNENKIYKLLNKKLIQIENSAKKDIQVRSEVVFLPYQASMWDSMESVWMEAREDENCDAYVIAIPYYEKNRDESFGKMHYDGDKYPDYVSVTDYRSYRIEERRPDIIYIQNPYDDWNAVISVHPKFFAEELKKHTDMLVYLPYFVAVNNRVDGDICLMPGVMYADKVIVQSEEVKRIYIDSIRKYERETNCKGAYGDLDQKILPLGSPKLDRIRRMMDSGKVEIPDEWKDRVCQADGKRKKVILYNTTLDTLLKHSETYMEKLKSVLSLFRQEKDVVLLWRPHPLLVSAIRSMRSDLYREYMEISEAFQREGWGIYDESADIDRAILLSDAYYGDMSSVVELYKATGKPIMIQCGNRSIGTVFNKLLFSCIKTDGKRTYAFSARNNGLFLLLKNGNAEFVANIPDEKIWSKNLYSDMILWNDFLFLIPGRANEIARVCLKTYEIRKIKIDQIEGWKRKKKKFSAALLWENELILLPEKYPAIVRMNLNSETLSYHYIKETEFCFKKGYYFDGENVYLPSTIAGFVLKYSLTSNEMEHIGIPNCGEGVWSLTECDGIKYLVSFPDSHIIRWDEKTGKFETLINEIAEYSGDGYGSSVILQRKENLVIFPIKANYVLEVDKDKGSVKKCDINWNYEKGKVLAYIAKDNNNLYFYRFMEKEGLFGDANGELLEVNADTLTVFHKEYDVEDSFAVFRATGETLVYERYGIGLSDFLKYVQESMDSERKVLHCSGGAYKIHKELLYGKT